MSEIYRFDHQPPRHRKRHLYIVASASFFCVAAIVVGVLLLIDQTTKPKQPVIGPKQPAGSISATTVGGSISVVETDYTMSLPSNWHQVANSASTPPNSVSWQSVIAPDVARYLTVYVDNIPTTMAVNRLLPVSAAGSGLTYGSLSDNCSSFSIGGQNLLPGSPTQPVQAKWQGVSFLCNLPDKIDNQVGTGSAEGINTVSVTGPLHGTHQYFILYNDRSAEPDYSILDAIISSFRAT